MAISGGYAGQLFGYLVGFGISMLKQSLLVGPQAFNVFDMSQISSNLLTLMVLITAAITLVYTFIYGYLCNFRMGNNFGYTLLIIYGTFIVLSTIFAVY